MDTHGKLMALGRPGQCAECGAELAAGTKAYWIRERRVVVCMGCSPTAIESAPLADEVPPLRADAPVEPSTLSPPAPAAPPLAWSTPTPIPVEEGTERGVAGGSAQREYDRRSQRELARKQQRVADDAQWRTTVRSDRPVLGRLVTALTPKPVIGPESQPTAAWKVGAQGERRVAEVLTGVARIVVLHDRLVPGEGGANIDHIVVGPSGVFVIDAKKYAGLLEVKDVGGMFRTDLRLYVAGRDRTKIVDAVLGQVAVVRTALGEDLADVPVRGVLCFVNADWGWGRLKAKQLKDVTCLWPLALADHVAAAGAVEDQLETIAERLRFVLRAAPAS